MRAVRGAILREDDRRITKEDGRCEHAGIVALHSHAYTRVYFTSTSSLQLNPCTHARSRTQSQYLLCAGGVFFFTLIYGFLQELVIVKIFDRQLSLFLALCQFWCYTVCSGMATVLMSPARAGLPGGSQGKESRFRGLARSTVLFLRSTPWRKFLSIAVLRTFDLGLTNSSMKYVNYPVKTLMKSSRVIFTMLFGTVIMKKRHRRTDYAVVCMMVVGLALFIYAETSASGDRGDTFSFVGIGMLTMSLLLDGVVVNSNELLMKQHR